MIEIFVCYFIIESLNINASPFGFLYWSVELFSKLRIVGIAGATNGAAVAKFVVLTALTPFERRLLCLVFRLRCYVLIVLLRFC